MLTHVVTPFGEVYNQTIKKITLPTTAGEITVLPNHAPIISVLKPGLITITNSEGQEEYISLSGGIMEIRPNGELYLMANTAEHAKDIDVDRAERAKKRAEELLAQHNTEDVEFAIIQSKIEKQIARLSAVNKYKR